jgi:hypothetical protein
MPRFPSTFSAQSAGVGRTVSWRLGLGLTLVLILAGVPEVRAQEAATSTPPAQEAASTAPAQGAASTAPAQEAASTTPTEEAAASSASTEKASQRPVPDYRGRAPPPTTAGDVLIWVPRVILFPPYLVAQYVIRTPVGALSTAAEKNHWPSSVFNFFAFGPDHKGGIFPVFLVNFGFRPSIGLHFFWEDTFTTGNKVTADAAWGGSNWISVGVGDRYSFTKNSSLAVEAHWNRRPDSIFYGIGSETPDTFPSRYGTDVIDGAVTYTQNIHRRLQLEAKARLFRTVFRDYTCCGDPSLQQRIEAGQLPAPPGFDENTTAAELGLKAVLDTRSPGPTNRSGVRVGLAVKPAVDVGQGFDRSWIHYAGAVEGSWDVTGYGRVLSLGVITLFSDPLGSQEVPFTELVSVGGTEPFAGFLAGRLRGRSAAASQLSWRWPVYPYLDGVAAVSFGNVFDAHLSNFRFDLLRLSAELGVRTVAGAGPGSFQFVIGVGTEPFSQGLRLTSFRFALGVTYGL